MVGDEQLDVNAHIVLHYWESGTKSGAGAARFTPTSPEATKRKGTLGTMSRKVVYPPLSSELHS